MAELFLTIGLILISLGTWLGPLMAICIHKIFSASASKSGQSAQFTTLDVLIPAHMEFQSLPASLRFFNELASDSRTQYFSQINTVAALSAWTGKEAEMASQTATTVLNSPEPGKWKALQMLVRSSKADWVALVDAGTVWNSGSLAVLENLMKQPDVVAINPTYQESGSAKKMLQKWIWGFESLLKKFENISGGPISLHGASIIYRREALVKAFDFLGDVEWLNDDVVVPLTVRDQNPGSRIVYTSEVVAMDLYPSSDHNESKRRKRLLMGNIQWVQAFFGHLLVSNWTLTALALRRISRMMWAWWAVFLGLGLLIASSQFGLFYWTLGLALGAFLVLASANSGRRLLEAFWVSLLCPGYFLFYKTNAAKLQWK